MLQPDVVTYLIRDAQSAGGPALWLLFRGLPALIGIVMILLFVTPVSAAVADDRDKQGLTLDEVAGGQLLMREGSSGAYQQAVMHSSTVHFDISGMVATVSLQQTFRNDSPHWREAVYAFPMPENAAVRGLEMRLGERRIVGRIEEKEAARKVYSAAKTAGKKASLVEQQRPNLFTNRIANIAPGETVSVTLDYVQPVEFAADAFSLRFPMTITPRYMPGRPLQTFHEEQTLTPNPYLGWATATAEVPDAAAISPVLHPSPGSDIGPINRIEVSATLDMGMPLASVESSYHDITLQRDGGVYSLQLVNGFSEMDRDFELRWRPVTGSFPAAAVFNESVGGEHFGLLMLLPPAAGKTPDPPARELVFVVDTSGSMGGVSIEQARASLSDALQHLRPLDSFNIIAFDSNYRKLFSQPMPASRHRVQQAMEFVRLLQASGGTEMMPALQAALSTSAEAAGQTDKMPARLRQVIFITDGAVGNEEALFAEIAGTLGDARLFAVGIGSAPNSWFMRKAADYGRGIHMHIGNVNEVAQKMGHLFDRLSRPVAVDLQVQWPAQVEAWPERLPDLYWGEPLLLAVSFGSNLPAGEVVISGTIEGNQWRRRISLAAGQDPQALPQHAGIASLWARRKIAGLLEQGVRGRDETAVRADVLSVALPHRLLSPYTSFVAVEQRIARPEGEQVTPTAVANTAPKGQAPQHFAYPATATTGPAKAWFGALLAFIAMITYLLRRPELDHVPASAP